MGVPATTAALVNGAMVHGLDYDDCYQGLALHPSGPTVPAALAMAERAGGISGKDLITAIAVGNDVCWRIGNAFDWKMDWFHTVTVGYFSAAVAASRILKLDAEKMFDAIGLAFGQAGCTGEMRLSSGSELAGSAVGGMMNGFPASRGNVLSALLAERGLHEVPGTSLKGGHPDSSTFSSAGCTVAKSSWTASAKRLDAMRSVFGPWPTCSSSHPAIDATLHDSFGITTSTRMRSRRSRYASGHAVDWTLCEPLEDRRRNPRTSMRTHATAYRSTSPLRPFGTVSPSPILPIAWKILVCDLASRVLPIWDESMQQFMPGIAGSHLVTIRMNDGKDYEHRTDLPYGRHPNDMARDRSSRRNSVIAPRTRAVRSRRNKPIVWSRRPSRSRELRRYI